jgi:hypothetical protein
MALNVTILPENETTIVLNETVHFVATATDYADNLTYQWYVDGVAVDGETERTYDFTPENAGGYQVSCYVEDDEANDTSDETPVIVESETIADLLEIIADNSNSTVDDLDIIKRAVE